jgi:hypothetical protein
LYRTSESSHELSNKSVTRDFPLGGSFWGDHSLGAAGQICYFKRKKYKYGTIFNMQERPESVINAKEARAQQQTPPPSKNGKAPESELEIESDSSIIDISYFLYRTSYKETPNPKRPLFVANVANVSLSFSFPVIHRRRSLVGKGGGKVPRKGLHVSG